MFKPHPRSDERKRSATTLIKYLLALKNPKVLTTHRRELLDVLLWKITVAESSKHKTRLQSEGARACRDKAKLRHEHVFQRAKMIEALESAAPDEVDEILASAVGCTVTIEEHTRLSRFDSEYGMTRYRKAGVAVIDTQTGRRLV